MPLNEDISIGGRANLNSFLQSSQQGANQAPGIMQLMQLLQGLQGERGALGQQISGITSASPEVQQLAHQAAFAPVEGLRSQLDAALLQAANSASSRGLGRGSISAALQAQAVPQVMGPALANAQGLESQLLLDIPFRERQFQGQFGLQSLGLGGQFAGQQMGLRDMAFANLSRSIEQGLQERQFKHGQGGGIGRALGGILGAGLGMFTGGLGSSLGRGLGGMLGGIDGGGTQYAASGGRADTSADYYWGGPGSMEG